jgi:hypothetical protein
MIQVSRLWLSAISLTFGLFVGIVGLLNFGEFNNFFWALSANLFYFVCLFVTTLAFKSNRMPTWAALLNVVAAIYIPLVVHTTHIGSLTGDSNTWYVTALAIIFGSMAVRHQVGIAIYATIILILQILLLGGLDFVSRSGLAGAVMLVAAAIAIGMGLDRSSKSVEEFQALGMRERHETLLAEKAREEHRIRLDEALAKALPTLREIADGKELLKIDRERVSNLAQELEDQIAGGRLVTTKIHNAIALARQRGIEVSILDEAPLEDKSDLSDLLDVVVAAIAEVNAGRIKLIAPRDENYLVRLTVTRPRVVTPDLDLKLGERQ